MSSHSGGSMYLFCSLSSCDIDRNLVCGRAESCPQSPVGLGPGLSRDVLAYGAWVQMQFGNIFFVVLFLIYVVHHSMRDVQIHGGGTEDRAL